MFIEAGVLYEAGDLSASRLVFLAIRKRAERTQNAEFLARAWTGLAAVDIKLGAIDPARHWLSRATAFFRRKHMKSEVVRVRWIAAEVAVAEGKYHAAERHLRTAIGKFLGLGEQMEAAFVTLDLLDLLVVTEAPLEERMRIAREVVKLFLQAGLRPSGAKALEHLRMAVDSGSTDRDHIRASKRSLQRVAPDVDLPGEAATSSPEVLS